jgi:hypothetical protein
LALSEVTSFSARSDAPTSAAQGGDHVQNLGNAALVEGMDGNAFAHQRGDNVGLQV